MKLTTKILLSIPSVIAFLYVFTFFFPANFAWLIPDMRSYYIVTSTVNLVYFLSVAVLIRRLWKLEKVERKKIVDGTALLIFVSVISVLIYIWKIDSQMVIESKSSSVRG